MDRLRLFAGGPKHGGAASAQFPELRHGYLIELKYLKRGDEASDGAVRQAVQDANGQLTRYLADERLERLYPCVRFTGVVVVFHGWEMVRCELAE